MKVLKVTKIKRNDLISYLVAMLCKNDDGEFVALTGEVARDKGLTRSNATAFFLSDVAKAIDENNEPAYLVGYFETKELAEQNALEKHRELHEDWLNTRNKPGDC